MNDTGSGSNVDFMAGFKKLLDSLVRPEPHGTIPRKGQTTAQSVENLQEIMALDAIAWEKDAKDYQEVITNLKRKVNTRDQTIEQLRLKVKSDGVRQVLRFIPDGSDEVVELEVTSAKRVGRDIVMMVSTGDQIRVLASQKYEVIKPPTRRRMVKRWGII